MRHVTGILDLPVVQRQGWKTSHRLLGEHVFQEVIDFYSMYRYAIFYILRSFQQEISLMNIFLKTKNGAYIRVRRP